MGMLRAIGQVMSIYYYLKYNDITILELDREPYTNYLVSILNCMENSSGPVTGKEFCWNKELMRAGGSAYQGASVFGTIAGAYGAGVFLSGPKTSAVLMKTAPKGI